MSWIFCVLFVSLSFAQTELDTIDVEAEKDIEQFTFTTSEKISTRELENQPLGIVSPELEKIPGLIPNQNGGPGGRISFFLRGTESRHLSFTLDSLKINDTSNTDRQFDAAFMTAPFIKEMDVYKGPQAVLYGSDAMGGLIEMKTRKGENAPETRVTLNGGSFGTIGTTLANDWKTKNHNGTVTFTRFHSDGISRINDKRYAADEKDATDITQITSSSEHRWAKKLQTDFLVSYLRGKSELDAFTTDTKNDFSRNDQYILQQKTSYDISKDQAVSLRNGVSRHQRFIESLSSGSEFFNGDLIQNEAIYSIQSGNFSSLAGIATERENAKAKNFDRSFDLHSGFLQTAWKKNDFKFHLGGRVDKHSRYGTFTTGAGGLGYKEVSLQYSQGYKAPSLYQLFGPDSFGSPVGNPDLLPETNHYTELSWKRIRESYEGAISLFQNRLSNLFTFEFGRGYFNQQRFIAEGIEIGGKLKRTQFEFAGSFTHQQFREEETPVLRRPYNMAHAGVSWFPVDTLELNVNGRWFSSRRDFGAKLNPYEVVDLGVRKSWDKDDVSVQLKNVLNREYEELYGFNVLPRSVFVNYTHRIQ